VRRDDLVEALRRRDVRDANPEMVDHAAGAQRAVMHRLGTVPVGVEQEGAEVVVAILGTQARCPVVPRRRVTGLVSVACESEKSSHSASCAPL